MARKQELTPAEIAEKAKIKAYNAARRKIKNKARLGCSKVGLRAMKLQLKYLESNDTILPSTLLDRDDTMIAVAEGILQYEDELTNPPKKKTKKVIN